MASEEIRNSASRCRPSFGCAEGRPHRAGHEAQPQEQADQQEDLPEAAEVDVLVALVAEPEIRLEA